MPVLDLPASINGPIDGARCQSYIYLLESLFFAGRKCVKGHIDICRGKREVPPLLRYMGKVCHTVVQFFNQGLHPHTGTVLVNKIKKKKL